MFTNQKRAYLVLADGTVFKGWSFGVEGTAVGEVVFTTGVVGYQETLTDPTYYGQIVTQTFPLIGNYGVNAEDLSSPDVHFHGYIVREWCDCPSNFRMTGTIDEFLKKNKVVGIYGIDTRALTRRLRENGTMPGMVTTEPVEDRMDAILEELKNYSIKDAIKAVTDNEIRRYTAENAKYNVVLMDFGYKRSIRSWLLKAGCNVTVVPPMTTAAQLKEMAPDGIVLSNGPGNPAENPEIIANLREIAELGIPVLGLCLGHQLMALAQGGKTVKLKYGHRGANQPVTDLDLHRTFITGQNHGYAVVGESIGPEIGHVSHVNANDRTCAGIRYHKIPCFTVQFYPEVSGGPREANYIFSEFASLIEKSKEGAR